MFAECDEAKDQFFDGASLAHSFQPGVAMKGVDSPPFAFS